MKNSNVFLITTTALSLSIASTGTVLANAVTFQNYTSNAIYVCQDNTGNQAQPLKPSTSTISFKIQKDSDTNFDLFTNTTVCYKDSSKLIAHDQIDAYYKSSEDNVHARWIDANPGRNSQYTCGGPDKLQVKVDQGCPHGAPGQHNTATITLLK